ncbi:MAG: methyltransferase domain-containing protein [Bacteroidetes bacterium]|nr:MAG: methyltransferase domain-containing protein [Bacteroidota bacterium]TNE96603.1 MAG: methyltransferase domain-containing protein [Bacteroidota bacterium]
MVGAISPSTRFLGEKMLENIDFDNVRSIVELGPGTGVFTDLIIERLRPDARLYVFELNEAFHQSLEKRIKDERVSVIHDSAEFISKYTGEDPVDVIVSSLPLMVFPDDLRKRVIQESFNILKRKGKYVQFQYSLQSKKLLEATFTNVNVRFTLKNFPPAFVYTCIK